MGTRFCPRDKNLLGYCSLNIDLSKTQLFPVRRPGNSFFSFWNNGLLKNSTNSYKSVQILYIRQMPYKMLLYLLRLVPFSCYRMEHIWACFRSNKYLNISKNLFLLVVDREMILRNLKSNDNCCFQRYNSFETKG